MKEEKTCFLDKKDLTLCYRGKPILLGNSYYFLSNGTIIKKNILGITRCDMGSGFWIVNFSGCTDIMAIDEETYQELKEIIKMVGN